jgi:hypothetical protein
MATAARDRLARTLRGDVQTAFSVTLTAAMGDLNLEVEGFGHVKFPVTPAKARKETGRVSGLFGKALLAADTVADAGTAAMLLRPFRIENLTGAYVDSFGKLAHGYGQQWTTELLRIWFGGDQPAWAYGRGQEQPQWVAGWLPSLCQGLHATSDAGAVAARRLLDLAWEWLGKDIQSRLALSPPSYRDQELGELGRPLASVLTAAAAIGSKHPRCYFQLYPRI